jgi:hypothetical protein
MNNYVFREEVFGVGGLGGVPGMVRDGADNLLRAYLADLINTRLRRDIPGLYASLSMMTFSRYGKYPGELLYDDPETLIKLLREHFMDDEMVLRIVKYMLEPIENTGAYGKKAVNALMNRNYEEFKRYLREALIKEAHKWSRKLLQ